MRKPPRRKIVKYLPTPRLLVAARALCGLTQGQLAAEADVAPASLARYEAGVGEIRSGTFEAILEVLAGYGIRFMQASPEVAMGFFLSKEGSLWAEMVRDEEASPSGKGGKSKKNVASDQP